MTQLTRSKLNGGIIMMNETKELVVDEKMAAEMGQSLDDICVHDAAAMNAATGMEFECNDGHLRAIYD